MMTVFKDGFYLFLQLIKKSPHLMLLLFAIVFINFYFMFPDLSLLQVQVDVDALVKLSIFMLISGLIYMYIIIMVGYELLSDKKQSFLAYAVDKFLILSVELVRAYNIILLFSLFFIIPGIYKYLRYIFVPYLALEGDENSDEGESDSLKISNALTKKKSVLLLVFVIYLLFIPFDFVTLALSDRRLSVLLILSATIFFVVLYHCLIIGIYKKLKNSDLNLS